MPFQNQINCLACDKAYIAQTMRQLNLQKEEKLQIAMRYREEINKPPIKGRDNFRICLNCDRLIDKEIRELENDPESLRLNVLKLTTINKCMICYDTLVEMRRPSV